MYGKMIDSKTFLIDDYGLEIRAGILYTVTDNINKTKTLFLNNGYNVTLNTWYTGYQMIELY